MNIKNKKSFLKNFLTTASALAVITGLSSNAMGAVRATQNAIPSNLTSGTNILLGVDNNTDSLTIAHASEISIGKGPANPIAITVNAAGSSIILKNTVGNAGVAATLPAINLGTSTTAITLIDAGSILTLNGGGNVYTKLSAIDGVGTVNITGGAANITYAGTIGATTPVTTVNINTGGNTATLSGAISTTTLNIKNGDTLAANSTAATGVTTVNIGEAGVGAGTLIVDANAAYNLNTASNIKFLHAGSLLKLTNATNTAHRVVTLQANLVPGGIPTDLFGSLEVNSNGTKTLDLAKAGAETIGTSTILRLNEFTVSGNQTSSIAPNIFAKTVNVTSTGGATFTGALAGGLNSVLNVKNGASLTANSTAATGMATVNIGETGVGAGTLIVDANAAYDLNTASNIKFLHAGSLLKLTNATNTAHRVVTLQANLVPGGAPTDLFGSLEVNSNGTKTLDLAKNAAETIGTSALFRLKEFTVSGDQATKIDPNIFAKTVTISSTGDVEFTGNMDGGLASAINFTAAGNTAFNGHVAATTIGYGTNARVVTIDDAKNITIQTITSTAASGSEMIFAGNTTVTLAGAKTVALDKIVAGANLKTVVFGAGTYTVADTQLSHVGGTLTYADGAEIVGGFNVAAGNAGTIKFLGDAKVTGNIGVVGRPVGAITVAGNNKTLQLDGNITATSLNANGGNTQDLKFINSGDVTVTGTVGNTKAFKQIEFKGGHKVTFVNALINPTTLLFSATTEVVTNAFNLGATAITKTANNSTLNVNDHQTITGNIANFGLLHVNGDKTVSINTANFLAGITTEVSGQATVDFVHNAGIPAIKSVGTNLKRVKMLEFTESGTVTGDAFALDIEVANGKTAKFDGNVVATNKLELKNAASTATFNKVNLDVNFNIRGLGIANFKKVTVTNAIGVGGTRLAQTNFTEDTVLSADVHSDVISFVNKKITPTKAVKLDGTTTFAGSELNLGAHDMTMVGGDVTFTGASKIKTKVDAGSLDLGNLVTGQGSKITLAGVNTLEINLDDAGVFPVDGTALKLITKEGNGTLAIDTTKVTIVATSAFSQWTKAVVGNELILTNKTKVEEVLEDDAKKAGETDVIPKEVREIIASFERNTDGHEFVKTLDKMDSANRVDAVSRLVNTTSNEVQQSTFESLKEVSGMITERITETTSFSTPVTSFGPKNDSGKNISGVSSGDEHDRYGIWGAPFYSKATQKRRGSSSGFKSTSYGGTVGLDTKATDDLMVGLAFSAMNSEIRHKDFKSGDKTKVTSYLLSGYANQQFSNNFFGQGVFSIGSSTADNKENRRISNTQLVTAEGKYSSMIFSSEVLGGYNHAVTDQLVVSPMAGLNYSRINSAGYKESGDAGTPLLDVSKKASQKLDIVGGVKVTTASFMANGVAITPAAHAFIRHDVIGKGAKVTAKLDGLATITEKAKLQKTFYNVGASLNAAYGAMDYGVSADAHFSNKYVGLQGSLKLRVNF
jgi:outer membrane autotransporter protein